MLKVCLVTMLLLLMQGCVFNRTTVDVHLPNLEEGAGHPVYINIDITVDDKDNPNFDTKLTPSGL